MGIIKDIVDIVVPRVQKRMEEEGLDIKEALNKELEEMGYIQKDDKVDEENIEEFGIYRVEGV
ncbi:hypothetical protein [Clostridium beijerinckii]|uniref:hypothetical protein n=2 Tax=Clostridium beijerinckii TaxID=1520 RepID=UPI00156F15DD|nr:hypothetical protein [Clostridium beijerinckii]NRT70016.1 hypothetical protein [Clostridium beijerinckii]